MADPGFPVGGRGPVRGACGPIRGCAPLMRALFAKNFAKMKELGPVGGRAPGTPPLDPPMTITKQIKSLPLLEYNAQNKK